MLLKPVSAGNQKDKACGKASHSSQHGEIVAVGAGHTNFTIMCSHGQY